MSSMCECSCQHLSSTPDTIGRTFPVKEIVNKKKREKKSPKYATKIHLDSLVLFCMVVIRLDIYSCVHALVLIKHSFCSPKGYVPAILDRASTDRSFELTCRVGRTWSLSTFPSCVRKFLLFILIHNLLCCKA